MGIPALPPVARDHGFAIEHPSNGDGSIAVGNRQCLIMESHHRPGGKRSTQPDGCPTSLAIPFKRSTHDIFLG